MTNLKPYYLKEMFDCLVKDIENFKNFPGLLAKSFKVYVKDNMAKFPQICNLLHTKKMGWKPFLANTSADGYGLALEFQLKQLQKN